MNAKEAAAHIRAIKGPRKYRMASTLGPYAPIAKTKLLQILDDHALNNWTLPAIEITECEDGKYIWIDRA